MFEYQPVKPKTSPDNALDAQPLEAPTPPVVAPSIKPVANEEITLGQWLEKIIEDIKNPSRLKPSASYQGYLTLLHKLEAEGTLINQPISSLGDESFVLLIKWVKKQKGKNWRLGSIAFGRGSQSCDDFLQGVIFKIAE